jgi:membrane protease YdiL (CAAX protease family)
MGPLATRAILLFAVWDLLLLGRLASRWLGSECATLASFLLATILVVARHGWEEAATGRSLLAAGLGAISGWATHPAWVVSIAALGAAFGLPPRGWEGPHAPSVALVIATVALAPVFEEVLYRGQLLIFALPHLEAWSVLGTFLVGLALGAARLLAGSLALCIGVHAGLNLAAVAWGRG